MVVTYHPTCKLQAYCGVLSKAGLISVTRLCYFVNDPEIVVNDHPVCVLQDYCGVLSEEAVRKNCVLVYELLDEVWFSRHYLAVVLLLNGPLLPTHQQLGCRTMPQAGCGM